MTNPVSPATTTTTGSASTNPLDPYSVKNAKDTKPPVQNSEVSKDSFLNLLVTQLRNQDPLQPVQNTEFIAQLAQFQSLESQLDTNSKISDLVSLQQSQLALSGLSQAALLVGKSVTWTDKDGKDGAGTVATVTVENGVMMINTENGKVPVGALTSIGIATNTPPSNGGSDPGAGSGSGNGTGTPPPAGSLQPKMSSNQPITGTGNAPAGQLQHNS